MHLDHIRPTNPFLARNVGTGMAPEVTCQHGEAAFGLHLLGAYSKPLRKTDTEINVLLPRCVAAQLVGALTAFLTYTEGEEASEAFMERAQHAFQVTLQDLQALSEQGRACCEAAFRTGGREHTCHSKQQP